MGHRSCGRFRSSRRRSGSTWKRADAGRADRLPHAVHSGHGVRAGQPRNSGGGRQGRDRHGADRTRAATSRSDSTASSWCTRRAALIPTRARFIFSPRCRTTCCATRRTPTATASSIGKFKPGQRVQLRVPVETWNDRLVLPVGAVAAKGPSRTCFRPAATHSCAARCTKSTATRCRS